MALLRDSSIEVEVLSGALLGLLLMFSLIKIAITKRTTSYLLCLKLAPQMNWNIFFSGRSCYCFPKAERREITDYDVKNGKAKILEHWIENPSHSTNIICDKSRHYISYSFVFYENEIAYQVDVRRFRIPPRVYHALSSLKKYVHGDTRQMQIEIRYIRNDVNSQLPEKVIEFNVKKYQSHRNFSCATGSLFILIFILFTANDYNTLSLMCIFIPIFLGGILAILILHFEVFKCLKENDDIIIYRRDQIDGK